MFARKFRILNSKNMTNGLDVDDRSHAQGDNGVHIRSFLILFGNEGLKRQSCYIYYEFQQLLDIFYITFLINCSVSFI
jgi:hypothetical protein